MERFANTPNTQLASSISDSATSISVASSATFPSAGNFRVLIDTEILKVTAVSGTTWTVTRGDGGTVAASHTSSTQIYGIVTKEALDAIISFYKDGTFLADRRIINLIGAISDDVGNSRVNIYVAKSDVIANLDGSVPLAGGIYRGTDSPYMQVSDGNNWVNYGPAIPHKIPPAASGLTWINQANATVTQRNDGFYLEDFSSGRGSGDQFHCLVKSVPGSTPWSLTVGGIPNLYQFNAGYMMWGPCICENGTTPKIMAWGLMSDNSALKTAGIKYNSPTSYSGNYCRNEEKLLFPTFWRIRNDGTKYRFSRSYDGIFWNELYSENIGTFLTATRYGVYINPANWNLGFNVTHWVEGS